MEVIGFGGTFYTLWSVEKREEFVSEWQSYDKIIYTYHKNLSKDLKDAFVKAGIQNLDESLRGKKRSFEICKKRITPSKMTDRELLFRIILVNEKENTLEVRKEALQRMLDLDFIKIKNGVYEIQSNVRFNDTWHHEQLSIDIKGTI